jgi:uncharacterized protein (TIGR04255 family)
MMTRPADLPDYDDPPVNEVIIGVQFAKIAITGAHIGLFWQELRDEYPTIEEHPPLESRLESFQPPRFALPMFGLVSWPGSRHWLISEDQVDLVQIQQDRLVYNWRRGPGNAHYPHFEALQEKFWAITNKWRTYIQNMGQVLDLTQWEVTYINHILRPEGQPKLADALSFWGAGLDQAMGGPADAGRMEAQRILTEAGTPWARMYVSVTTGMRPDQVPLVTFELTVRGPPENEDSWDRMRNQLLNARRQIVTAFDTLTTPEMHAVWGKRK